MPFYCRGEVRPRTGDKVKWRGTIAEWKCPTDGIGEAIIVSDGAIQEQSRIGMGVVTNRYSFNFDRQLWEHRPSR